MSTKATKGSAYIVMSPELSSLGRTVKPGLICGAHSYPIYAGDVIRSSLIKTLEGAYSSVSASDSLPTAAQGPVFKFDVADFDPRLRFAQGFWSGSADANVDLAIRARVTSPTGAELITTTFRGQGHGSEDGQGCGMGADALSDAAAKAIRSAMENFVDKVINTGALQQPIAQTTQAATASAK
ncbi:hypothetical protein ACFSHT_10270 [Paraburkholderia silviterrae]|nr:hypothetical protein [Paraburkholderia silviterrae]